MTSRRRRFNAASRWKGVHFDREKNAYRAYITVERKRRHLGYWTVEIAAAVAVDAATRAIYGKDGRYNFPGPGELSAL